jgi:preprotein translocase subunit SecE
MSVTGVGMIAGRARAVTEPARRFWHFLQESWVELKKVHWPSRKETQATTVVVVLVVLLVAVYLGVVDWVLTKIAQLLLGGR